MRNGISNNISVCEQKNEEVNWRFGAMAMAREKYRESIMDVQIIMVGKYRTYKIAYIRLLYDT